MGTTTRTLVAIRRLVGHCFYCGRLVHAGSLTCAACKPHLDDDPHYNAAARTPTAPDAWNTCA